MVKKIKNNLFQPLLKGWGIISVGSLIVGLGNYLFNLLMGRLLGPKEYGLLAALVALASMVSIFSTSINLVVCKFVAGLFIGRQFGKIKTLILKFFKKILPFALGLFLIYCVLSFFIAEFLQLPSNLLVLILSFDFLVSLFLPIVLGGLRGMQKFFALAAASILGVIFKVGLGIIAVFSGLGIAGVVAGLVITDIVVFLFGFWQLKLPKKSVSFEIGQKQVLSYGGGVFLATLGLTLLFNSDVILARHFLDATDAGYYAAISLLGKIVFFATASVGTAFFPISAADFTQKKYGGGNLKWSFYLIFSSALIFISIYLFLPEFIVKIFFGQKFLAIVPYLGVAAVVFAVYSLDNILTLYYLSAGRKNFSLVLLAGALLEIGLIGAYHKNIWQILYVMLAVMIAVLAGLVIMLKIPKVTPISPASPRLRRASN